MTNYKQLLENVMPFCYDENGTCLNCRCYAGKKHHRTCDVDIAEAALAKEETEETIAHMEIEEDK